MRQTWFNKIAASCLFILLMIGTASAGWAAGGEGSFKDVPPSFWGYETIIWGVENNITNGFADGTFRPNDKVTEEQFLAMWLRANGYSLISPQGVHWSDPYYAVALQLRLPLTGERDTAMNRQRVAEIMTAFHGQQLKGAEAVQYLLDQGWSRGKTAPTVEGFRGQDPLTRAEAVQFIRNVLTSAEAADPPEQRKPSTPEEDTSNDQMDSDQLTGDEQLMLQLVNEERVKAGLPALKVDMELTKVARIKSKDMVDNNYFSHDSPTYGSPFDMMQQFGITYRAAGENLAGNQSVEAAHQALMNSQGHRANILNESFTHIGIGIVEGSPYGKIYTQMFIGK